MKRSSPVRMPTLFRSTTVTHFFHPEVITYLGEAQVLAFVVVRFILLFIAILAVYDGDLLRCDIPHKETTVDRHYCYDAFYWPVPHMLFWIGFACAVAITWILYTAYAKYQVNTHKNRLRSIITRIMVGYIIQTVVRISFEIASLVLQTKYYGFYVPNVYNCTHTLQITVNMTDTKFYPCIVPKPSGKMAYLSLMFLFALFAVLIAIVDIVYIVYKAYRDRSLKRSFPVFLSEGRPEDEETLLMSPPKSGHPITFNMTKVRPPDNTVIRHLPKPVAYYYPRQELMHQIQEKLTVQRLVALVGLRGSGKTQLALKIGDDMVSKKEVTVAWMFNARVFETVTYGLEVLCEHLQFDIKNVVEQGTSDSDVLGMFLDRVLAKLEKKNISCYFVFDDVAASVAPVLECRLKNRARFTSVITSTENVLSEEPFIMFVRGFKKEEAINFLKEEVTFTEEATVNVLRLIEELHNLPFSLALARSYIVNSDGRVNIQEYIRSLKYLENSEIDQSDQDFFKDVDQQMLKALVVSVNVLSAGLYGNCMRRLAMASFLQACDIPMFLVTDICGSETREFVDILKTMALLSEHALSDLVLVTCHRALQHVLWSELTPERRTTLLNDCFSLLVNHIERNQRYGRGNTAMFHTNSLLEPHVFLVLRQIEAESLNLETKLFLVHCHQVLAEDCSERGHVQQAEAHLLTAKQMIYEVLGSPEDQLDAEAMTAIANNNNKGDGAMSQPVTTPYIAAYKSKFILERIENVQNDKENMMVLQAIALRIVIGKQLKPTEIEVIRKKLSETKRSVEWPENGVVTMELYEQLVSFKAALPLELLSEVIFSELIVTVLYTYGRLYFRQSRLAPSEVPKIKDYIRDLETAASLCDRIQKKFSVSLAHHIYVDRNALLYLNIEGGRKTRKEFQDDLEHAKYMYTELLSDEKDYYQFGVLRMSRLREDANHCILCRRQLIQCCVHFIQLEVMPCAERAQLFAEGEVHSQKMLQLIERELHEGRQDIPHLGANYNKAAELALLFNDPEHNQEAIDLYTKGYEVEKRSGGTVSMTLLDSLLGLANACKEQELYREGISYAQSCVDAASSIVGYSRHRDRANRLKRDLRTRQNKEEMAQKGTV